jgi:hypothetical protein
MENISVLSIPRIRTDKKIRTNLTKSAASTRETKTNLVIGKLLSEGGENFIDYLDRHNLANDPNSLVLPSKLHYYYDSEELKGVTTLINVKKLNLIKNLGDFFQTINTVLNPKANFIGCFSELKSRPGVSYISRLYKRFIFFLDARFDIEIDKKDLSRLLESHGFQLIDMTEIDGLTYFRSQTNRRTVI